MAEAIKDGPAAKAGIKTGDTIVAVDGERIKEAKDLSRSVAQVAPGKSLSLTLYRDGKERTVTLEVGEPAEGRLSPASIRNLSGGLRTPGKLLDTGILAYSPA